jgi:hypothetical protein
MIEKARQDVSIPPVSVVEHAVAVMANSTTSIKRPPNKLMGLSKPSRNRRRRTRS